MKKLLSDTFKSTLVVAGVVVSSAAFANHHEADNGKCESMNSASFSISGLDTNNDQSISLDEYLKGDPNNTEKTFKHVDANKDNKLDFAEQKEIEAVYKLMHESYKSDTKSI